MTITAVRPGMRAAHALTSPFTPIGHTPGGQPIYPVQGGRSGGGVQFAVGDDEGDDPEFDDQDDDGDEDDEDAAPTARTRTGRRARDNADDDGDEAEWTPPDRESFDRLTAALKRANAEAGKRRRIGKEAERLGIADLSTWLTERGIDPQTGQPYGDDVIGTDEEDESSGRSLDDYEREPEPPRETERDRRQRDKDIARKMLAAEQRGKATARDEMMPILAEQAARLALRDAGFVGKGSRIDRVLRMIDPASLELDIDDSGFELVGIDDEIEKIRDEFPEFFKDEDAPARRRPAATTGRARTGARDVDGGDRGRPAKRVGSWKDQISAQLVNRGRA